VIISRSYGKYEKVIDHFKKFGEFFIICSSKEHNRQNNQSSNCYTGKAVTRSVISIDFSLLD